MTIFFRYILNSFFFNFVSLIVILLFSNTEYISAQNINETMKDENFYKQRGEYILENTSKILNKTKDTTYADFWNLALAQSMLKADKNLIFENLKKSKNKDIIKFAILTQDYIEQCGSVEKTYFYYSIGDDYVKLIKDLDNNYNSIVKKEDSLKVKQLDSFPTFLNKKYLFDLVTKMNVYDKSYRGLNNFLEDPFLQEKQKLLDYKNQEYLNKIFLKIGFPDDSILPINYRNIIGKIYVHCPDLEFINKWLPHFENAYANHMIGSSIFMIIIDKVYWRNHGKQIFGTQSGIAFEDKKIIQEYRIKYGL